MGEFSLLHSLIQLRLSTAVLVAGDFHTPLDWDPQPTEGKCKNLRFQAHHDTLSGG
jgi:hypothetical protein